MDFSFQPYPIYSDASPSQEQSRRTMPFALPVSSYFRRPSKVVKASRNQSPKHLVRRKTTAATHGHPRQTSMDRTSRPTRASEPNLNQVRPLSWHPTSYEQPFDFSHYSQVNFFPQFDFSSSPFNTAEINGLVTPMSTAVPSEPQIQEFMTPLDDYSPFAFPNVEFVNEYAPKLDSSYPLQQNYPTEEQSYVFEQIPYTYQYPIQPIYQTQPSNYVQFNVDTAPPSPTLLPMQNFDNCGATSPFALGSPRVEKEELVGMGLYDRPQDVQSSTLLSRGSTSVAALTAGIGKGLKLEESFEPPPAEEEDEEEQQQQQEEEEEEEDDDDGDDTEKKDEPEDVNAPNPSMTNLQPPYVYVDDQSNYTGQSFFFDDKESYYQMATAAEINSPYYQVTEWVPTTAQPYGWI